MGRQSRRDAQLNLAIYRRAGVLAANPHAHFSERFRQAFTGQLAMDWGDLAVLAACMLLAFASLWLFRRLSPYFEELL